VDGDPSRYVLPGCFCSFVRAECAANALPSDRGGEVSLEIQVLSPSRKDQPRLSDEHSVLAQTGKDRVACVAEFENLLGQGQQFVVGQEIESLGTAWRHCGSDLDNEAKRGSTCTA